MYIHSYYNELEIRWDPEKSAQLKGSRGVSFEEIVLARLLKVIEHPVRPHQELILLLYEDYVWVVPCVVGIGEVFLKTFFPSRKYTKAWRRGALQ